jgi:hypothetical protein
MPVSSRLIEIGTETGLKIAIAIELVLVLVLVLVFANAIAVTHCRRPGRATRQNAHPWRWRQVLLQFGRRLFANQPWQRLWLANRLYRQR